VLHWSSHESSVDAGESGGVFVFQHRNWFARVAPTGRNTEIIYKTKTKGEIQLLKKKGSDVLKICKDVRIYMYEL